MGGIAVARQTIAGGLRQLGLECGDTVLVRTALKSIGVKNENPAIALIQALLDVVGPDGTIVGLAFNIGSWFPRLHKKNVINLQTEPYAGGFVRALVNWPGSLRSTHPTNSFVALGGSARKIVDGHDENTTCFFPMEQLVKLEGKMVLIGCVNTSPGFSTVHLAQEKLGLARQSLLKGLQGTYFEKGGEVKLFKRKDIPGCSMGFSKFYSNYIREEKLSVGYVGNAYSILIGARDAFDIEYNILRKNPKFALCDNPGCFICRGTRLYNLSDMPGFYFLQVPKKIYNMIVNHR
jgi:aminoglycoside N3'-acetyltransferase